jgi:hypothetical protein
VVLLMPEAVRGLFLSPVITEEWCGNKLSKTSLKTDVVQPASKTMGAIV